MLGFSPFFPPKNKIRHTRMILSTLRAEWPSSFLELRMNIFFGDITQPRDPPLHAVIFYLSLWALSLQSGMDDQSRRVHAYTAPKIHWRKRRTRWFPRARAKVSLVQSICLPGPFVEGEPRFRLGEKESRTVHSITSMVYVSKQQHQQICDRMDA